ncbi:alkaline phosphatase family protein [Dehalobacter sp. DCM]|uniref:alkaline phosphatase family protein n=1 Tax=Dehalobacter sp. DCM TaxID=2907827 RepID=UPI00308171DA|nr:alkaline phosphatase family protein [Dehalobacter sp. DCM]
MHLTMVFVDGFGLGEEQDNPIVLSDTPYFDGLLGGNFLWGKNRQITYRNTKLFALDPTLGVEGTPQSATGQTSLWTGINAARCIGRHLQAYPNTELKQIIKENSIFKQLVAQGQKATFANAYTRSYDEMIASGKARHSASTLCTLAGGLRLRQKEDLIAGRAIYQDITNEILFTKYMETGVPQIKPFAAGQNLAAISREHDFTLFEYFQTDIRGHKRNMTEAIKAIEILDEFIGGFLSAVKSDFSKEKMALIITSDHGNIEDLTTSSHTLNKVPALCWSNFFMEWPDLKDITDVTPAILDILYTQDHYDSNKQAM